MEHDHALVEAIAGGCTEALREAYERHGRSVFETARALLGQRARAEEVVQDVFVKLWDKPDRFDESRGTLRAFLNTLSYCRAIDVARSEGARRRREEREARLTGRSLTVVDAAQAAIVSDELRDALGRLCATEREAIEMAYFGGYSYREVATRLAVPEGTVKNRIRSGLASLRELLAPDDEAVELMVATA
jgi:RNA polymerase sigma-70 factor (ECF subfamily)